MATATKTASKVRSYRNVSFTGISLGALVAELIGSAVLTLAVLNTQGNAIIAGLTVVILSLVLANLSGGHINPVITMGLWATRQVRTLKALLYIVAQILGAMLALVIVTKFLSGASDQFGGALGAYALFDRGEPGEWKPFFGELVGSLIFAFGAASAFLAKKTGYDASFTVGGSLLIGLLVATIGSYAVLNPAVAIALSAFEKGGFWSVAAYGIAPLISGMVGFWLYRMLQRDVDKVASNAK